MLAYLHKRAALSKRPSGRAQCAHRLFIAREGKQSYRSLKARMQASKLSYRHETSATINLCALGEILSHASHLKIFLVNFYPKCRLYRCEVNKCQGITVTRSKLGQSDGSTRLLLEERLDVAIAAPHLLPMTALYYGRR